MSPSDDRIKVPVNGHSTDLKVETGSAGATASAGTGPGGETVAGVEPESARLSASPTQLAVGFGAITGLIVLLIGAMRRRRG